VLRKGLAGAGREVMSRRTLALRPKNADVEIGIVLATFFIRGTGQIGWPRSVGVAVAFALGTSVLPWLLMFPAMGYGWFGVHGPEGTRLFSSSLITHAFCGLGLWVAASILKLS
jgi:hypothetical protein